MRKAWELPQNPCLVGWVASRSDLVTEFTVPACPYPLTKEMLLTEPQLCLKAGIILVFYPQCCLEMREQDRVILQGFSSMWDLRIW